MRPEHKWENLPVQSNRKGAKKSGGLYPEATRRAHAAVILVSGMRESFVDWNKKGDVVWCQKPRGTRPPWGTQT